MSFATRPTYIVSSPRCPPECRLHDENCEFQVRWEINPHMRLGSVDAVLAAQQHEIFVATLKRAGAKVLVAPFLHGVFDSVFVKDNAVLISNGSEKKALVAMPSTSQRSAEQVARTLQFRSFGFQVTAQATEHLEGGDVLFVPGFRKIFFGYGLRSSVSAASELRKLCSYEVVDLELIDPFFFHLDTALNFVRLNDKTIAFAYREAFSNSAWENLVTDRSLSSVIEVSREEALMFGLNWIEINGTVILGTSAPSITRMLKSLGKNVVNLNLSQFQLAGGSVACLATKIHETEQSKTEHASEHNVNSLPIATREVFHGEI